MLCTKYRLFFIILLLFASFFIMLIISEKYQIILKGLEKDKGVQ